MLGSAQTHAPLTPERKKNLYTPKQALRCPLWLSWTCPSTRCGSCPPTSAPRCPRCASCTWRATSWGRCQSHSQRCGCVNVCLPVTALASAATWGRLVKAAQAHAQPPEFPLPTLSIKPHIIQAPLKDLFASENPLGSLPPCLARCSRLEKLSLAACGLKGQLPDHIGDMGSLRCDLVRLC